MTLLDEAIPESAEVSEFAPPSHDNPVLPTFGVPCMERPGGDVPAGIPRLRYNPYAPSSKQSAFLMLTCIDALYGGAAYGGKSIALLMAALQFADVPGYNALIVRRTLQDLSLPDGLIDIAHDWLDGTDATYNGNKHRWTFPSGATLTFGYIGHLGSEKRYKSSQFQFIGFDELTEFPWEEQYTYLFSRLRHGADAGAAPDGTRMHDIPLRVRGATNPGGVGMPWVKARYVADDTKFAPFLPSKMKDNPGADPEYERSLSMLNEVERKRLQDGDWDVVEVPGALWKFKDFVFTDRLEPLPASAVDVRVLSIDPSVSEETGKGDEVGIVIGSLTGGVVTIELDLSDKMHPDDWARMAVTAYHAYGCDRVVVEDNMGKELVVSALGNAADNMGVERPRIYKLTAKDTKEGRAIPVVQAYRARTPGMDPKDDASRSPRVIHDLTVRSGPMEAQMTSWVPGQKTPGGSKSPDRLDALVWLVRHLLFGDGKPATYRTAKGRTNVRSTMGAKMPGT